MQVKKVSEKSLKKRIIKNSFWSFFSSTINRVGALAFTIVLARFLMPERYGIYSLVLSIAMIFFTFTDLGINSTFTRYLSSALVKKPKKIPAYHQYLLKLKFIFTLISSLLLIVLAYPLSFYVFKNPNLFLPFIVASFYIFILSFEKFYTTPFYAAEKIKYLSFKESINQILRIVLALSIFYFIVSSYQVMGIFLALTLSNLFVLILTFFYLKKLIPKLFSKSKESIDKKRVRNFAGWLTIATISGIFFLYVDTIIIGLFLMTEYVGYYRIAFSLMFGVASFIAFLNPLFLSIFTKIDKKETEKVLNKVFRYTGILAIPSSFGLLVLGRYFLRFFYGFAYLPSSLPLYFLSFLILPIILEGIFLSLFSSKEKPKIFVKLIILTSIINVILNLIFIKLFILISPLWAISGIAIATLISWIFHFTASLYIIKKQFKFNLSLKVLLKPIIVSLIMAGVLFYLTILIKEINLFLGISLVLLGFLIYLFLMILIKGIKKEDLALFKILLKR